VNLEGRGIKDHRNLDREKLLFVFTVGDLDIRRVGDFYACHRRAK